MFNYIGFDEFIDLVRQVLVMVEDMDEKTAVICRSEPTHNTSPIRAAVLSDVSVNLSLKVMNRGGRLICKRRRSLEVI